jgi:hypothetical protein
MPTANLDRSQIADGPANGVTDLPLGRLEDRLADGFHALAISGFRLVTDGGHGLLLPNRLVAGAVAGVLLLFINDLLDRLTWSTPAT